MSPYLQMALSALGGGLLSGLTGFGALIIMVPLMLLFMDPDTAIPVGVICGMSTQGTGTFLYRTQLKTDSLLPLLTGSLPGVWVGGTFLVYVSEMYLKAALGLLLIVYAAWNLKDDNAPRRPLSVVWAYAAGFFSGALGGAFGITGPPAIMYAARSGWPPDAIRGRLGAFFLILFVFIAATQVYHGLFTMQVLKLAAVAVPICIVSVVCGVRIAAMLKPAQYMRLLFLLILGMGLSLCRPAFMELFFEIFKG